MDNLQIVA